jgi:hypothetical protein
VFGTVASDPTVSRTIADLAAAGPQALTAIRAAHAHARQRVWDHAGTPTAEHDLVVIDLDATLITAHSDKQDATSTRKKGFGHHPILAHIDHGTDGTGEQVAALLRPGNAGSNTATDHITTLDLALDQIPTRNREPDRAGRVPVLVRTDSGGASLAFTHHITDAGMDFSIGASLHNFDIHTALDALPRQAWRRAINGDGWPRDGAWVAEATRLVDLSTWPAGTRLILRKERPHPGAQLRITDSDGLRVTGLLTTTRGGRITELELRHRRRARQEDRIRNAKDTGLRNLPYHDRGHNQVWMLICGLAGDLIAWTQRLALSGAHRVAEPKRLRLQIFGVAARLVRTARRSRLAIAAVWPWAEVIVTAHQKLAVFAAT